MAIWKRLKKYKDADIKEAEKMISEETEKSDFAAMWLSAVWTLMLPAFAAVLVLAGILYLIFT
ncbi:MAG: hypothetical protein GX684_07400 [Ruminococcaceae bacterium]|nr:hypothetical protein [Oscillospiraceae bacterium]